MPAPTRSLWSSRPATSAAAVPLRAPSPADGLARHAPMAALVAANLAPIAGALFFGWTLFDVLKMYWMESAVIGVFAVLRILIASGGDEQLPREAPLWLKLPVRALVAAFFCVHFGGFMYGHGAFLFAFFQQQALEVEQGALMGGVMDALRDGVRSPMVWALFASHGCAFVLGFLWSGEWERTSFGEQMFRPYPRVFAMHFTLMLGGLLFMLLRLPAAAAAVLVAVKIYVDLWSLRRETAQAGGAL